MNLNIGQETQAQIEARNKEIMDMAVDTLDRKLNPHKYEVKKVENKEMSIGEIVFIAIGVVVLLLILC
jgi:hypothetical protein